MHHTGYEPWQSVGWSMPAMFSYNRYCGSLASQRYTKRVRIRVIL